MQTSRMEQRDGSPGEKNERKREPARDKPKVRTFRDLIAWQRAMELAKAVYTVTRRMPDSERFGLTMQLRRAAVLVPSNIAEGHARQSRADYLRHLRIARGSLAEMFTQLELATDMKMIPQDQYLADLMNAEDRILQGLIRSLEAKNSQTR